jgi:hypothetical protein
MIAAIICAGVAVLCAVALVMIMMDDEVWK